ncbi:hypothetical protein BKA65DRAFT_544813 [Rhexocercosporidium sp. MPI-PUGE-AT-0058]|nr:hypothetical protein BKA65DRAFT_544813 [Rhexocercosporidium sp. MPI-PUGE-AT-0058]
MNFLAYLPHFNEYFTDLPPTGSTSQRPFQSKSNSQISSLTSTLLTLLTTLVTILLVLLPAIFIIIITYMEYHRLPCTIPLVKKLRTSIALAAGCCCRACLRIVDVTELDRREEGIGDGKDSGVDENEEESPEGNWTTARKGCYRDLGQRERYGKLFKNSFGGSERDAMLLKDMEGSEDGFAVLL